MEILEILLNLSCVDSLSFSQKNSHQFQIAACNPSFVVHSVFSLVTGVACLVK